MWLLCTSRSELLLLGLRVWVDEHPEVISYNLDLDKRNFRSYLSTLQKLNIGKGSLTKRSS